MKMWKKMALTGATLTAVLALAACGNGSSTKKTGESETKKDEKTSILMYQIGTAPKNMDKLMENANKIIGEKLNAKLEIKYIDWGDYKEKMSIITSSGENYDIAFADNYVVNAQKGAYADLTELYKKEGKELYESLDPAYIKGNTINGKIYAVPVNANVASQQVLSFNKNLVDKYNLDISKVNSYADLEPLLAVIKEKEPGIVPFPAGQTSANFFHPLGNEMPFGVDHDGDTTKIVNPYEVESYKEKLRVIRGFYQKGYIPADIATSKATYPLEKETWFVREETQGPADFGDSLLTTVAGYPIVSRPVTAAYKTSGSTQVANFVISKTSKNKEKAMEVLNLLNTNKELLNGLVYGPEGENWEKDSAGENRIKLLPGYKSDTRMSAWNLGNNYILYTTDKVKDADIEQSKKVLKEAKESPALGFTVNTDSIKSEISSVQNVMKQYIKNIGTGTVDPDQAIEEMLTKLKSEGSYEKVLKEIQRQYDEFLKNKN
ncbi:MULTISPECIES: ABC transporter substrate-binding protein [unclassified Granulicatella]|uniref:ABC transporter substrate-binding protein n=1 Tax=unclassified Granulicatella TaxID=2630493 RepID=UPI00107346D9|nr:MULTISPECIES: ABC transporter substrate-binding protein [unclassified Granulicatella]MBF0779559.1 extracellular solute-binding protein [Granulicatella sp. 19428wC4_WM01]TFU96365.1 extracellular solute-binding protein [Granulicatella sp. WM01]